MVTTTKRGTVYLLGLLTAFALVLSACGGTEPDDVVDDDPVTGEADEEATPADEEVAEDAEAEAEAASREPLDPPATVTFATLRNDIPIPYGVEMGFFEEEGLDVRVEIIGSGAELLPLMASGDVDVGVSSPAAGLFNALARGIPVSMVADAGRFEDGFGFGAFVARSELVDSGELQTPEDLEGRSISITAPGTSAEALVVMMLEGTGLDHTSDVTIEQMTFPTALAALEGGELDVAYLIEPFITRAEDEGFGVRWIGHDEIDPGRQLAVLMYGPRLTEDEREVGERFMVGWLRSARAYNAAFATEEGAERDEFLAIMSDHIGIEADIVGRQVPRYLDPDGELNIDSLREQLSFYDGLGQLEGDAIDVDDVVDTGFSEYAAEVLGPDG